MSTRRNMLIGLGTLAAGGGIVIGTGAFTTVTAERTVSVNVAEDSQALVGIEVNERYGGQEDGVAVFDLQENLFSGTGFNPQGTTTLYGALAITNNSGIETDQMEVLLSYASDDVEVPDGPAVPGTDYDSQFYFRKFEEGNAPSGVDPFEGLSFEGDAEDLGDPAALGVGDTTVFDLVVAPGGDLSPGQDYAVDVTITANLEGN